MTQLSPIVNAIYPSATGLQLSWGSNTTAVVQPGLCRDSTDVFDINIGGFGGASPAAVTINAAVNGLNGLDTGSLGNNKFYAVYAIADAAGFNPSGCIISLNTSQPLLPAGLFPSNYSIWRRIGWLLTDGSAHFLKFYQAGNAGGKLYQWDAPIAVTVTSSGTSATYAALDLSVGIPPVNFGQAFIKYKWTNNAAADSLNFTPHGATGDYYTTLGIVAGVAQEDSFEILPLIGSSKPEIDYKVSAGTLNNVYVQGWVDYL